MKSVSYICSTFIRDMGWLIVMVLFRLVETYDGRQSSKLGHTGSKHDEHKICLPFFIQNIHTVLAC